MRSTPRPELVTTTLLGLLAHDPQHAYSLCRSLSALGVQVGDRSAVYQRLHDLERRLLVTSHWETAGRGPARRVYRITDAGLQSLRAAMPVAIADRRGGA